MFRHIKISFDVWLWFCLRWIISGALTQTHVLLKIPFKGNYPSFYCYMPDYFFYQWSVSAVIGSIPLLGYVSMFLQNILLFHDVMTVFCFLQCCIFLGPEHSKHLIHFTEWIKSAQIRQRVAYLVISISLNGHRSGELNHN